MPDVVLFARDGDDVCLEVRAELLVPDAERLQRSPVARTGIAVMNQTAKPAITTRIARTVSAIRTLAGFKAIRASS